MSINLMAWRATASIPSIGAEKEYTQVIRLRVPLGSGQAKVSRVRRVNNDSHDWDLTLNSIRRNVGTCTTYARLNSFCFG
jgi:hypothetical protein